MHRLPKPRRPRFVRRAGANYTPMNKTTLAVAVALIVGFTAVSADKEKPAKVAAGLAGTWQLVSTKYGDAKEFTDYPADRVRLKLITATHFTWLDYPADSKKIASAAGGSYTLDADAYTESVEFVGEGMESYLGKKQTFKVKVEGDKLTQSGQLSDGLKIEEVWRRLK